MEFSVSCCGYSSCCYSRISTWNEKSWISFLAILCFERLQRPHFCSRVPYSLRISPKIHQTWTSFILISDWKLVNMRYSCPRGKTIALVFSSNWMLLKFVHFDYRLKSNENEPFLAYSWAITSVFCPKLATLQIPSYLLQAEKWWTWAIDSHKQSL